MRRVIYYIGVFLFSLFLIIGILLAAISSEQVQNAVAKLVTQELSRGLEADVSIGQIEYAFPMRVRIHNVCLHDQQADTLAFIQEMYARFRPLALLDQEIRFSRVDIRGTRAHVYALPNGEYNYAFLARAFRSDGESGSFEALLSVRDIHIEDMQLRWEDYTINLASSDMDLSHFTRDSIDAKINNLQATIRRGNEKLEIRDFQAHLQRANTALRFPTLRVQLPRSEVDASGINITLPSGTITQVGTMHNTRIDLTLRTAELQPADLAILNPQLKRISGKFSMTGQLHGAVDSVAASDLSLSYNGKRLIRGDVSAVGLPNIDSTRFHIHCEDIHITAADLRKFMDDWHNAETDQPEIIQRLKDLHFRGDADGQIRDLRLNGVFTTALGTVGVNGSFRADSAFKDLQYNARFQANQFRLGELLGTKEVGNITGDIRAQGSYQPRTIDTRVVADIAQVTLHGYTYQSIHVDGHYRPNLFDGLLTLNDPNAHLSFNGRVDMTRKYPDIDCNLSVQRLNLTALKLAGNLPNLTAGASMKMRVSGSDIDHMNGTILLDSLHLYDSNRHLHMSHLTANANTNGAKKQIIINSDFLDADINGHFYFEDIPAVAKSIVSRIIPESILDNTRTFAVGSQHASRGTQDININIKGKNLGDLLSMFGLNVPLGPSQDITLAVQDAGKRFSLDAEQASMPLGKNDIDDLRLHLDNYQGNPQLQASAQAMGFLTNIQMALQGNNLHADAQFLPTNDQSPVRIDDIHLDTRFRTLYNKPQIDLHVDSFNIAFEDSTFRFDDIIIGYTAADKSIHIDQLHAYTSSLAQQLSIQGVASRNMNDALNIRLQDINAGYLMPLVVKEESFKMGGTVDGQATIYAVLNKPMIEAQVTIDDYSMGDEVIGDAVGNVTFDPARSMLEFEAQVADSIRKRAEVQGAVQLGGNGEWEINIKPTHIPLAFVNYWTKDVLPDIGGYGTGFVKVCGKKGETYVLTRAKAEDAIVEVPFTGCHYHVNDTIYMDSTSIRFPHMILKDDDGNPIEFEGILTHNQFKNFEFHLIAKPHKAMVLDLPYKEGESIQGRVYAEGEARIDGNEKLISISANATTAKNSQFRLAIGGASTESESNFVHFVDSLRTVLPGKEPMPADSTASALPRTSQHSHADSAVIHLRVPSEPSTRIKLALNIETTPLLNFQLLLNERTGDMIQARGEGALRLTYDSHLDEFKLMGTYTAESGSLGFTLGNIIRRNFSIGNGSTIVWNGNPADPDLNVKAAYHVTANLRDLFGEEISSIGVTRSSVPVNTCLNMTGRLGNPTLKFGIELPMSEEGIQNQVRAIINTEEMLMRQVVYLLVFGRFYTPEYMMTSSGYGLNETYSILSSTVTGQINNWLGKLTDVFTMGIQVRSEGEGATASQEYEAQFQLQPVDRLIINGNVGYRYNDISNRPFFGDLDAEVMLTDDGQLRLKAYTHTVDKYSLRQANTIQGIGFLWRYNFNIPSKDQRKQIQAERKALREIKQKAKEEKKQAKAAEKQAKKEAKEKAKAATKETVNK